MSNVRKGINRYMDPKRRAAKQARHRENQKNRADLHQQKFLAGTGGGLACIKRNEVQLAIDAISNHA